MQLLALGFLAGILFSILVIVTLIYFKKPMENKIKVVERFIDGKNPKMKGYVFEPASDEIEEAKEFREQVIQENDKLGRDTKIKDLI